MEQKIAQHVFIVLLLLLHAKMNVIIFQDSKYLEYSQILSLCIHFPF